MDVNRKWIELRQSTAACAGARSKTNLMRAANVRQNRVKGHTANVRQNKVQLKERRAGLI